MATAMNLLRYLISIVFLANLLVFICLNFETARADHSGATQQDDSKMLHPGHQDSEASSETVPELPVKTDEDSPANSTETTSEEDSVHSRTNIAPAETNSSSPRDYYQVLATYMRPEVFEHFIKGLNKTLDAHAKYAHPDFSHADTPEDQQHKVKYPCMRRPAGHRTAQVRIVNGTELMAAVGFSYKPPNQDNSSSVLGGYCAFVMFYAPWCQFSAAAAPGFNAIGRAFPDLEVLAIDAFQHNSLNTLYGIVAVPNVLLFHNNKPVMRFNYSQRTFDVFRDFIKNFTGLEPNSSVQVSALDSQGPLSSVATEEPDYALWLSWLLLASVVVWFLKQRLGSALMDRGRTFVGYARQVWRTGEFYDQVGVLAHDHHE